jgi:2,5-furandicarboxylate decarboxylase 1
LTPSAEGAGRPAVDQRRCLAGYLDEIEQRIPGSVWRITEEVAVEYEITALQMGLERLGRRPILVIQRPRLADGSIAEIPVVTNLHASRVLTADVFGLDDHRRAASALVRQMGAPIPPVTVDRDAAPVTEREFSASEIDLTRLPILTQHALDAGPYLSAAHVTTFDPATGIDNTAVQRAWVKGPRELRLYPFAGGHNAANIASWWAAGQDAPVALWIGHHPAINVGSNQKLPHPMSHWGRAGALFGAPVRLVATKLFGESLMVPADAEIVIEGRIRANELRAEGPFGEYTGYLGPQRPSPVIDVEHVSMRRHPLYHDYASGQPDMLVPDNMMLESALFESLEPTVPSLRQVHVPTSGRRFHCYVRLDHPTGDEAHEAIRRALENRRIKHVVVVDEDIDIFDEAGVLWAIATRVQWSRDVLGFTGKECSPGDPSLPAGVKVSDKAGIDATLPRSLDASRPRPSAGIIAPGGGLDPAAVARRLGRSGLGHLVAE